MRVPPRAPPCVRACANANPTPVYPCIRIRHATLYKPITQPAEQIPEAGTCAQLLCSTCTRQPERVYTLVYT